MIDQVKKRISEIEKQPEVDEGVDDDDRAEGSTGDQDGQDEAEARLEVRRELSPVFLWYINCVKNNGGMTKHSEGFLPPSYGCVISCLELKLWQS